MTNEMKQALEVLGEDEKRVLNNDQRKAVAKIMEFIEARTPRTAVEELEAEQEAAERKLEKDLGVDKLKLQKEALKTELEKVKEKLTEAGFGDYGSGNGTQRDKLQKEYKAKIEAANASFRNKYDFLRTNIWLVRTVKELKDLLNKTL